MSDAIAHTGHRLLGNGMRFPGKALDRPVRIHVRRDGINHLGLVSFTHEGECIVRCSGHSTETVTGPTYDLAVASWRALFGTDS